MYEELKAKIVKHCPELMELSFGCRFEDSLKNAGTIVAITDYVTKELPFDIHYLMDDNSTEIEESASEWFKEEMTILGHEPELTDVLRAIEQSNDHAWFHSNGIVAVRNKDGEYVWDKRYSFTKPLKNQSPETLEWLNSVIE